MSIAKRYVLYPIQHDAIWNMYKKHVASFWTAEEVEYSDTDDDDDEDAGDEEEEKK